MLLSVIIALAILNLSYMFAASAIHKLRAPLHFQQIVRDYQLVPTTATAIISKSLPRVEIAVGLALLASPVRLMALAGSTLLVLLYQALNQLHSNNQLIQKISRHG